MINDSSTNDRKLQEGKSLVCAIEKHKSISVIFKKDNFIVLIIRDEVFLTLNVSFGRAVGFCGLLSERNQRKAPNEIFS